ncbi:MAG TPA: hypothetical protein VK509_08430, partial [Polyangiales bacterium]|nr:hypothetical protein [Polyangiales bacterium]
LEGNLHAGLPIEGQPFTVVVDVSDPQSGVELARLMRDGRVLAVAVGDGQIRYEAPGPALSETIRYAVYVRDRSGRERIVDPIAVYTIADDQPPQIAQISTSSPLAYGQLSATVNATDDLGVASIRAQWRGMAFTQTFTGAQPNVSHTFSIDDSLFAPPNATGDVLLEVTVTDTLGQTTNQSAAVHVLRDQAPNAALVSVTAPGASFFDTAVPVALDLPAASDDGPVSELRVAIVDVSRSQAVVLPSQPGAAHLQYALLSPPDDGTAALRFRVRLTDRAGNINEGPIQTVALTQRPNLALFDAAGDAALNHLSVAAGSALPAQVRVVDSAGRGVPNQAVAFALTGPAANGLALGTATTGSTGYASFSVATLRAAGAYSLSAKVVDFPSVAATHAFQIIPAAPEHLELARIAPVAAGQAFALQLRSVDAAGNTSTTGTQEVLTVRIENSGFHFGFANDVRVEPAIDPGCNCAVGEQGTIKLASGLASVALSASTSAGTYTAKLITPAGVALPVHYDDDGNALTPSVPVISVVIDVRPATPARLRWQLQSMTNRVLGDPARLETTETATVQVAVTDVYGNVVTAVPSNGSYVPSTFSLNVHIDGSAVSGGLHDRTLTLIAGTSVLGVTDAVAQSVTLSANQLVGLPSGFDSSATMPLTFLEPLPAIIDGGFVAAVDDITPDISFTFNRAIALPAGASAAAVVRRSGAPVAGTFTNTSTTLRFQFAGEVALDTCYELDTRSSALRDAANNAPVLAQQITVCSPQVAVPPQVPPFVLEGAVNTLNVNVAQAIRAATSNGLISIGASTVPFDWATGTYTGPAFSQPPAIPDGTSVSVGVSGVYQGGALRVANTITLRALLAHGDLDGDGLENRIEIALGLDPLRSDSDGDGIADGNEDSDGDGLSNLDEQQRGTDPSKRDSDADG